MRGQSEARALEVPLVRVRRRNRLARDRRRRPRPRSRPRADGGRLSRSPRRSKRGTRLYRPPTSSESWHRIPDTGWGCTSGRSWRTTITGARNGSSNGPTGRSRTAGWRPGRYTSGDRESAGSPGWRRRPPGRSSVTASTGSRRGRRRPAAPWSSSSRRRNSGRRSPATSGRRRGSRRSRSRSSTATTWRSSCPAGTARAWSASTAASGRSRGTCDRSLPAPRSAGGIGLVDESDLADVAAQGGIGLEGVAAGLALVLAVGAAFPLVSVLGHVRADAAAPDSRNGYFP